MASFAEMIYGTAAQTAAKQGEGLPEAFAQGAQLALKREELANTRAALEKQRQDLELAKDQKILDTIKLATDIQEKDPRAAQMILKNVLPAKVSMYGREQQYSPATLELLASSPLARAKAQGLQLELQEKVSRGEISATEASKQFGAAVGDPELLLNLDTDKLYEASKFATSEENQERRTKMMAEATAQRQEREIESTFRKKVSEKTAATYEAWEAQGGRAGFQKNIGAIDKAIADLESGKVKFGTWDKKIPFGSNEDVLARLDPDAKALVDSVLGAVNMKASLADPNPTQKQIDQILNRTIDPRLNNAANIAKLRAMKAQLTADVAAKERTFAREGADLPKRMQGTPQAGEDTAPTGMNLQSLDDPKVKASLKARIAKNPANAPAIAQRFGVSPAQLTKLLAD